MAVAYKTKTRWTNGAAVGVARRGSGGGGIAGVTERGRRDEILFSSLVVTLLC